MHTRGMCHIKCTCTCIQIMHVHIDNTTSLGCIHIHAVMQLTHLPEQKKETFSVFWHSFYTVQSFHSHLQQPARALTTRTLVWRG